MPDGSFLDAISIEVGEGGRGEGGKLALVPAYSRGISLTRCVLLSYVPSLMKRSTLNRQFFRMVKSDTSRIGLCFRYWHHRFSVGRFRRIQPKLTMNSSI